VAAKERKEHEGKRRKQKAEILLHFILLTFPFAFLAFLCGLQLLNSG